MCHKSLTMKKTSSAILRAAQAAVLASTAAAGTHYTRLAYIETKTAPTYIDTGFMPTPKTRTAIDFQFLDTATQYRVFGLQYGNLYYAVYENGNGNWAYNFNTGNSSWNQISPAKAVDTARHFIDYNFTNAAGQACLTIDGGATASVTGLLGTHNRNATGTLYLGAAHTGASSYSNASKHRIYSCAIWDDGEPVRDFVPAAYNGATGLWDRVNGAFHANKGSGAYAGVSGIGAVEPTNDMVCVVSTAPDLPDSMASLGLWAGYEAGDEETFSAPAFYTNAAGTVALTCTGWKLYDAAGTLLDSGSDTSVRYVHPTPAAYRRLEWQVSTEYKVAATAGEGGMVSPAVQWVASGATASVTATPDATSAFYRWTGDVSAADASSPTLSFAVTAPISLAASFGSVFYVSTDGDDANGGTSWNDAFASPEKALFVAADRAVIHVAAGEYALAETAALTNAVTVVGAGRDATTFKAPANGAFTAVKVANANARLEGVTLTGISFTAQPSTAASGGTYDSGGNYKACLGLAVSAGTVARCAVSNNTCNLRTPYGFVVMSGGTLDDVVVANNKVNRGYGFASGFGVYMSGGTMTNCAVLGNSASGQQRGSVYMSGSAKIIGTEVAGNRGGGSDYHNGVYATDANNLIDRCRIHANTHNGVRLVGTMRDSLIYCNTNSGTSYAGVLMDNANGRMYNCTIWGNVTKGATDGRSGLQQSAGTAVNNIVWGNGPAGSTFGSVLVTGGTFNTNIVDVALSRGTGVIVADPMFADAAAHDFSLTLASPAIDAAAPIASVTTDIDGRARGAAPDIGAYEFASDGGALACAIVVSQARHPSGAAPSLRAAVSGASNPSFAWYVDGEPTTQTAQTATFAGLGLGYHTVRLVVTDGDATAADEVADAFVILPTETYVSTTGSDTFPYDTAEKAARSVNDAFNATWSDNAAAGTVHVGAGTFPLADTLLMKTPYRILGAGRDATILTVGGAAIRALNIGHEAADVRDLTVTGCTNTLGGTAIYMSAGWLENVRVTRNRQNSTGDALPGGAGLTLAGGTVTNCLIDGNFGNATYGNTPSVGLRMTGGTVVDSVICSNTMARTQQQGVGVNMSDGTIRRCRIFANKSTSNSTESNGHGIYMTGGTVEYCNIFSNGYNGVYMTAGTLRNCAIYGHKASHNIFSGVRNAGGTLQNCTIYGNQCTVATAGIHGLQQSKGTTVNSIIWGNGPDGNTLGSCSVSDGAFRTNIVDLAVSSGVGCKVSDPLFEDAGAFDFHLRFGSPAIDEAAPLTAVTVDLDGVARPQNDAWDIGAYEYVPGANVICGIVQPQAVYPDGGTFAASAVVEGADTDGMTYTWKLALPGGVATNTTTTAEPAFSYANAAVGIYELSLAVTTAGGDTYAATAPVTFEAKPLVAYVSHDGSATYPYDTADKATPSLNDAYAALWLSAASTATVHIAEGEYALADGTTVNTPARILGAGRDATTLNGAAIANTMRAFTVSSPDALLEGFTLTGCTNTLAGSGIALSAGTLSGLRIAYNQTKMPNTSIPGGGGIHMSGGTVTNCLVHGNSLVSDYGGSYGAGIKMTGGLVVDSEIAANWRNRHQSFGHGVSMEGGRLLRCRIAGNHSGANTSEVAGCGIHADSRERRCVIENCAVVSNGVHGVCLINGGTMRNTLVAGHANTSIELFYNASRVSNAGVYATGAALVNCTIVDNISGGDHADLWHDSASGSVVNTIAESAAVSAATASCNLLGADPGFKARAKGDYRPAFGSPAIDAGDNTPWAGVADATDLAGNPRIVPRRDGVVDIGCYEALTPAATLLIVQ